MSKALGIDVLISQYFFHKILEDTKAMLAKFWGTSQPVSRLKYKMCATFVSMLPFRCEK